MQATHHSSAICVLIRADRKQPFLVPMPSDTAFDTAIDEWGRTGVLPSSFLQDPLSVLKLIDLIPTFVQPLTKSRFLNVVDQIVRMVYTNPTFHKILLDRINGPAPETAIWLCSSLVPLAPSLAVQLQESPNVATVKFKNSESPHLYEALDSNYQGKFVVLVYAVGWLEYAALLKSTKNEIARHTAVALYSETRANPKSIPMQIKLGLAEHAYRIFDKSSAYLPFAVSWLSLLNNASHKSILRWEQIKLVLRKSQAALASRGQLANATFDSLCTLVGEDPWAHKKNICDKMVDLELHKLIVPYLGRPEYASRAVKLVDLIAETRAEELYYAGGLEYTRALMAMQILENSDKLVSICNRLEQAR